MCSCGAAWLSVLGAGGEHAGADEQGGLQHVRARQQGLRLHAPAQVSGRVELSGKLRFASSGSRVGRTGEPPEQTSGARALLVAPRRLLLHVDPGVRARVCNLLGNMCRHSAFFYSALERHGLVQPLIERCQDPDRSTRKFACFAIGNAGERGGRGRRCGRDSSLSRTPIRKPVEQTTPRASPSRRVPQRVAVRGAPAVHPPAGGAAAHRRGGQDARQRRRRAGQPRAQQLAAVRRPRAGASPLCATGGTRARCRLVSGRHGCVRDARESRALRVSRRRAR